MRNETRRSMLKMSLLVPAAGFLAAKTGSAQASAATRPLYPGPVFFVKGVYQQPAEKMAEWKAQGVNTIFTMNAGADPVQWTNAAMTQGLYMVRHPAGVDEKNYSQLDRDVFDRDMSNPYLLALAMVDEPSNLKPGGKDITYEDVSATPEEVDVVARAWSVGNKPLWLNHIGVHINNVHLEKIMSDYADSPYVDWLSHDSYPIASGYDVVFDFDDYMSTHQGHAIDRLLRWSGGRPQFSFVGLSKFDGSVGRETTPAEFRVQAWSSIIHGAIGIIYFTFKFSPEFSYDATPQDLRKELKIFHAEIDEIEDILVDKQKGGRRPHVILKSVRDLNGRTDSLPYPFEASSTHTDQGDYKIILNLSAKPAEFTYEPWGLSKVAFEPYECRRGYDAAAFSRT